MRVGGKNIKLADPRVEYDPSFPEVLRKRTGEAQFEEMQAFKEVLDRNRRKEDERKGSTLIGKA